MKISTKGRYALRMMTDIALHSGGECVSLKDVSARQKISVKYLEQIVMQLTKAGLLKSVRGPQGGYKLTRRAEDYTVGEILGVTEGSLAPVPCIEMGSSACELYDTCPTSGFWKRVYDAVMNVVDNTTLYDLAEEYKQKTENGNDYCI
ncbi:MAG: Rrf2 family transcriptional regulator [Ruminococcus sp.]|nr:Rrf2 family transcriptional regulator [Ruminococcus sp.]MDY3895690.1 Rrf2 family transcriptional regulator [Candidatus Fimenecus sp.]